MQKTLSKQILIGLMMFGTLVGAGFASGKEIWFYFAQFGNISFLMIALTGVLFFFFSLVFFKLGRKFQIDTVQKCNQIIFKRFAVVGEVVLVLSNLILLSSMFAGADSLFNLILPNLPYRLAAVLTSIITFFVVLFGLKGITRANVLIVPLLLAVVFVVLVSSFTSGETFWANFHLEASVLNAMLSALLFVSSNMFFSGFILAKMGKDLSSKEIVGGSFFGSLFLVISMIGITMAIYLNPSVIDSDMPIVAIASELNNVFAICVLIIVWLGLVTTAFALLYTISNWLKSYFGKSTLATFVATFIALCLSGFGFSSFVEVVYPIMGAFGFIYVILSLIALKKVNKGKNTQKEKQKIPHKS